MKVSAGIFAIFTIHELLRPVYTSVAKKTRRLRLSATARGFAFLNIVAVRGTVLYHLPDSLNHRAVE
jgi:hypothetical protein